MVNLPALFLILKSVEIIVRARFSCSVASLISQIEALLNCTVGSRQQHIDIFYPPLTHISFSFSCPLSCCVSPIVLSAFRGPRPGFPAGPGTFWCLGATAWDSGPEGTTGDMWSRSTAPRLPFRVVIPGDSDLLLSQLHDQHHPQLCTGRVLLKSWMAAYVMLPCLIIGAS